MLYDKENDLHEVALALNGVADAILKLGNGSVPSSSPVGAVERLADKIREGAETVAGQLEEVAEATDFGCVADAIKTIDVQQLADAISDGNYNERSLSVAITHAGKEIAGGLKDLASAIREMRGVTA
jgi:hypothetical protein